MLCSAIDAPAVSRRDIVTYYEQCEWDYRWAWDLDASMAMHIGYWDRSTRSLRHALARQNELLAEMAGIKRGQLVLDAGCGVGGSSIYLAKRYGCHVVGISLSRRQVERAKRNARRCGVANRTEFLVADFTVQAFRSGAFDVVWALESVCYAGDKSDFVRESQRLLTSGGRLILADGFAARLFIDASANGRMRRWLRSWAVPNLWTAEQWHIALAAAGYGSICFRDITRNVIPSAKLMWRRSVCALPFAFLAEHTGLRTRVQTLNVLGGVRQLGVWRSGLAIYGMISAVRE